MLQKYSYMQALKGLALSGNMECILSEVKRVVSNFKDMKWQTSYLAGKKGGKVSF